MPKLYRLAMSLILVITVLGAVPAAFGQLIIPADRSPPPPIGFSFDGTWTCGTGNSVASLKIATPDRSRRAHLTSQRDCRNPKTGFTGVTLSGTTATEAASF